MKLVQRSEFALAIILSVYFLLGGVHLALTPVYEKPDEQWHSAYAFYLAQRGQLPPLVLDPVQNPADQIAGHPPLFYAAGALLLKAAASPLVLPELRSNPFWGYPALGTVPDNKNRFLHAPDELGRPDLRGVYLLRGLSLFLGAGAILAAYGIGLVLTGQTMLGLMSAALVAVLPPVHLYRQLGEQRCAGGVVDGTGAARADPRPAARRLTGDSGAPSACWPAWRR